MSTKATPKNQLVVFILAISAIVLEGFSAALPLKPAPSSISSCPGRAVACPALLATAVHGNNNNNAFDLIGEDLQESLSTQLGIIEPNEVQNSSLPLAVRGEDVFIISQTGSGKTLTFLLPILHRLNEKSSKVMKAIVIGPTSELVEQHAAIVAKLAPSLVDRILFKTPHQFLSDLKHNTHKD